MPDFGNAYLAKKHSKGPWFLGDTIYYRCKSGYARPDLIPVTCTEGPKGPVWTDPVGDCSGRNFIALVNPEWGEGVLIAS